ncbi:ankyrin repeat domain-containing protein [Cytobacillus pseudoceanisediminis]|uniref:Ankyrin repeat domain-containing protein n=1 Tax=Cytobacillus pseudoceanisediminis TaxID=3051614 RepID=A0ABZ2ZNT0_9BACI
MSKKFMEAVTNSNLEEMEEMIKANPDLLNLRSQTGQSPVLAAIYNGAGKSLEFLLKKDIPLDIFEAAAAGNLSRVKELVEMNPKLVTEYANDGFTALGLASYLGHKEIVEYLVQKGADVNSASKNSMKVMPLHSAVATKKVDIAEVLLKNGAKVNAKQDSGWTPLHEAALHGHSDMIKLLLRFGADKTIKKDDGDTPLDVALHNKKENVADLLIPQGIKG